MTREKVILASEFWLTADFFQPTPKFRWCSNDKQGQGWNRIQMISAVSFITSTIAYARTKINNKNKQKTSESRTHLMTVLRRYDLLLLLSWCFTSTETIRLIRDGEPRAATSTFTMLLYLHKNHKAY